MDVQRFRDSRESELNAFKRQYEFLKTQYSSALGSAVRETDPASQQNLIQQVLQINATMAEELRNIIAKLNQGSQAFNPKELNDLTQELIKYQKDYEEIEKSQDKVNTLKRISQTNSQKLQAATTMYYIYVAIVVSMVFLVATLVLKSGWATQVVSTVQTTLSQ